ncbi:MAG: hypothetical protein KDE47_29205, partial [Caldilineaceae bacterium]|nr:hypothetical protein [Caldilineaceae bacterium]
LGMQASILLLMLFVLGFWLLMNFGAKKFDRYLLPVYPVLDLGAGLAYVAAAGWIWQRRSLQARGRGQLAFLALIIGLQASLALPHYPYCLTYYNPLLGDVQAVINVMQIGRGEGANLAAQYLNAQATIDNRSAPTAASAFPNGPFSYFYAGRTVPPTFWTLADYAVVYAQDFQRRMPSPRQIAWFERLTPMTQIDLHGIEYARIYDLSAAPLPTFVTTWAQGETPQIRLNAYELTAGTVHPGESIRTTFYLENLAPIADDLNVLVRLVGADGSEIARAEGWPWGAPTSDWPVNEIRPDGHTLPIPEGTAPGLYRLEIGFYEPASQATLPAIQSSTDEQLPDLVPLDFIQVGDLPTAPAVALEPPY